MLIAVTYPRAVVARLPAAPRFSPIAILVRSLTTSIRFKNCLGLRPPGDSSVVAEDDPVRFAIIARHQRLRQRADYRTW